jgi:hypothetical protein
MVFVMLNTSLEFASHGSILAKFSVGINPAEIIKFHALDGSFRILVDSRPGIKERATN